MTSFLAFTILQYSSTPTLPEPYLILNTCSNHFSDSLSVICSRLATAGEKIAKIPVALAQHSLSAFTISPSIRTSRRLILFRTLPWTFRGLPTYTGLMKSIEIDLVMGICLSKWIVAQLMISSKIVLRTPPWTRLFQPQRCWGTVTFEVTVVSSAQKDICRPEGFVGLQPKQL